MDEKRIKTALISVYHKDGLEEIVRKLQGEGVKILSTGGTETFIKSLGVECESVENLTGYPAILGGRVKTLHPKVMGGILARIEREEDQTQLQKYEIPTIDLVIVDLYPFEETLARGASEEEIIEKIDIGGISMIRAAAKNFKDVLVVASKGKYRDLLELLNSKGASSNLQERKKYARNAFAVSSRYDSAIFSYFDGGEKTAFRWSEDTPKVLRYGENPHQKGIFYGKFEDCFEQLHGKEISYNNLLDIDAAVNLISEFEEQTFAILKHNNACGIATRESMLQAWQDALAGDPISAFGGILITNGKIDLSTAEEINKIFFEVIIAPQYEENALAILKQKKNRIILVYKGLNQRNEWQVRSLLNGILIQERDLYQETKKDCKFVTNLYANEEQERDLLFANKIVKHSKSNAIVLARGGQLLASGIGQTSRVDALKQAIEKARGFGFDLRGAVMASDAFFPFPDCVQIAGEAGITSVIHPGGSINDQKSIDYCNEHDMSMAVTGYRHFKH